ncbi:peptidylprolyl isomerase [Planctobacterium marinum]|uniref:Peptidyl-prolyl cis-trans isomerase n=1 Tax=Planctobacterium marinum TaxID=1631968 RepID=A0AA48HFH2_9ALTE|nr:peptidyl-prolyl cis-trans isomerase [Planctobacterium marinum]
MFFTSRYLVALLAMISFSISAQSKDGSHIQPDNFYPKVKIETDLGNMTVELDRRRAPITVNNFLRYVEKGSYDNTVFHRIIPGFVVQGGGYDAEFNTLPAFGQIYNESGNGLKNDMYTVAMARGDDPHSANRQFFFNVQDNRSLNPGRNWGYTVFGLVLEGAEVVDKLAEVETAYNMELGWRDVPVENVMLKKVTLLPEPVVAGQ